MRPRPSFLPLVFWLASSLSPATEPPRFLIGTVAGANEAGDHGPALAAQLTSVEGLSADSAGNLYIADAAGHRVRRVSPSGIVTSIAGDGNPGFAGDGSASAQSQLSAPYDIVAGPNGVLYIADYQNLRVRRISADGVIQTVAGGGERPRSVEGQALGIRFLGPRNLALDPAGNLYISDFGDHRVYCLSSDGRIQAIAGNGIRGAGKDGPALLSELDSPAGLALGPNGALYIADSGNGRIRRVLNGHITTITAARDNKQVLIAPVSLAIDYASHLYVVDSRDEGGSRRDVLWRISPSGEAMLLYETGAGGPSAPDRIRAVCLDPRGAIYLGGGGLVVRLTGLGQASPVAGGGNFRTVRDGSPALSSYLFGPRGIAVDAAGGICFAEPLDARVRCLTPDGRLRFFAGGGSDSPGDGGPAASARLFSPVALAASGSGVMYIADSLGHRLRAVRPSGIMFSLAGNGTPGLSDDSVDAAYSLVNRPSGVAAGAEGDVYFSDQGNLRVRKITRAGRIVTVAGSGVRGYYGDGGPAAQAQLNFPGALALDASGNLFITDTGNHVVRRVTPAGLITTYAGSGVRGFSGDGGLATQAALNLENPGALAVDAAGSLYVADTRNNRIRCVTPGGLIFTVAGTGEPGFRGDGGPAADARLNLPAGLAVDASGNLLVADTGNHRIRLLSRLAVPPAPVELPEEVAVRHAASWSLGSLAPGLLVSIFGNVIAGERTDTVVRFAGFAAPVFYARQDQINVQAPYEIAGKDSVAVEVFRDGKLRGRATVSVAYAVPAFFTRADGRQVLAVNEDGSLNSPERPAVRASIVTFYATGEGLTTPASSTGVPASAPLPQPRLPVSLRVGSAAASILYAGAAPGLVGVLQVNAELPGPFSPAGELPVTLTVGAAVSPLGPVIHIR